MAGQERKTEAGSRDELGWRDLGSQLYLASVLRAEPRTNGCRQLVVSYLL